MAGKKFRKYKKRIYKKFKKQRRSIVSFVPNKISTGPLPQRLVAGLRYVSYQALNPGAGTAALKVFKANSCYDPDYSAGGHQPYGYDQIAELYEFNRVLSSKVRCTLMPSGTHYSMPIVNGVFLSQNPTPDNAIQELVEHGSKYKMSYDYNDQGHPDRVLTLKYHAKTFWGVKDVDDDELLQSETGADPVKLAYYVFFSGAADGTSDPDGTQGFYVVVDYLVEFMNLRLLSGS